MSYGVGSEPDWAAMADQHDHEIRKQKRIKVIGTVVAATVVVGGITAGAVAMSGGGSKGKPQAKDHAAVAASDGLGGGSSVAVDGSSASAAPSLSASASASAAGSPSAAPSLSASAKPSAAGGHSSGPSAAPGAPASQAAPPLPGAPGRPDTSRGEIKNGHSGMALEIENSRLDDGAAADQWTYNPKNNTMNWYLHWVGDSWEIRNVNSNLCLQIPDGPSGKAGDGIHADQWTCNGAPGQHWDLRPGVVGGQQVVNHRTGECLEVENSQTTNGAVIQQWTCHMFDDHSWILPS